MTQEEKALAGEQLENAGIYKLSDLPKVTIVWDELPTPALKYLNYIIPIVCYGRGCELHMKELKVYTTIYLPLIRATLKSRK